MSSPPRERMAAMLGLNQCVVEVCVGCEARARLRGEVDASGLAPLIRRALRKEGIGWSVKVREVPCLYRCPLDGITVRAGALPEDRLSGHLRVWKDGSRKEDNIEWAVNVCRRTLAGRTHRSP